MNCRANCCGDETRKPPLQVLAAAVLVDVALFLLHHGDEVLGLWSKSVIGWSQLQVLAVSSN